MTLLELITALGLMSVLLGTATLHFQSIKPAWELKAAVRQVVLDLKTSRTRAIAEGRPYRLLFDAPGATYERQRQNASRQYESTGSAIELPPSVQVLDCTARGSAISFQPRGHAGSFGTLTLQNELGDQRQIVVDMAGRARVR
jgi:Tfp pilus assembly protein FimT